MWVDPAFLLFFFLHTVLKGINSGQDVTDHTSNENRTVSVKWTAVDFDTELLSKEKEKRNKNVFYTKETSTKMKTTKWTWLLQFVLVHHCYFSMTWEEQLDYSLSHHKGRQHRLGASSATQPSESWLYVDSSDVDKVDV